MEIRQLRYFRAVAEAGSFARGANYLRVAQPALSRSIAKLEEELGQHLFVRQSTGVSLTEAGTRLYEQASEILTKVRDIVDRMTEGGEPSGIVRFGAPQTVHADLMMPVAKAFLSRYGRCELDLVQDSGLRLREMVSDGALDMAIVPTTSDATLQCTSLIQESFCLICTQEQRTAFGESVSLPEISDLPVISIGYPGALRLSIGRQFPDAPMQLNIRSEVNSASLLLDLVRGGIGYGLAPYSTVTQNTGDQICSVPIEGMSICWSLVASYSRLRLIAVQTLQKMIVDHARDPAATANWPTASVL